jgi:putative hydrolase of the HAD superfamily
MIKTVLFDADGVIINGELFSDVLERDYGLTKKNTLDFFKGKFLDCLTGKADLRQEIEPFLKTWNINKSVDDFLKYWFESEHKINEQLIIYINKLKEKGINCYIATNQEKYRTKYLLEQTGFSKIFNNVFSSAQLGYRKPHENFYLSIIDKLKVNKNEILFWDNSMSHIEAAKQFGIQAELYSNFDRFKNIMNQYLEIK